MTNLESKEKFIQAWGNLGTSWGLNKTMAKIFAVLLITKRPLSIEEIKAELLISTGNANMNIRALIDWGIVYKIDVKGERKDFFTCEKDIWTMTRQVAAERKKRELDPLFKTVKQVKKLESVNSDDDREFERILSDLDKTLHLADSVLKRFVESDNDMIPKLIKFLFGSKNPLGQ